MNTYDRCDHCGCKLTEKTGRDYVQAYGGAWLDICDNCSAALDQCDAHANRLLTDDSDPLDCPA